MMRLIACFCLTLLFVGATLAQPNADRTEPFTGIITGDRVNVRSGASLNYYRVTTLNDGDLVQVRSQLYKWYEIAPPDEVYALISKQYVQTEGADQAGRVTGDRVNVRAPSPQGPDSSYKIQTTLNSGDEVRIVGAEGDWYRIAPPDAATLWVHSDYIREATDAEIRAARSESAETTEAGTAAADPPAGEKTTAGTSDPTRSEEQTSPRPADHDGNDEARGQQDSTGNRQVAMDATDTAGASETRTEQPTDTDHQPATDGTDKARGNDTATRAAGEVTTNDTAADADARDSQRSADDDSEATAGDNRPQSTSDTETGEIAQTATSDADHDATRALDKRLNELERRFAEQSARPLTQQTGLESLRDGYRQLNEADELTDEQQVVVNTRLELLNGRLELRQAMAELDRQKQALEERRRDRPLHYDAVGRLVASSIYDGEDMPRLYRLTDSMTGLTVGYVEPSDSVDLVDALGRTVGVVGETRYDPSLRLKVITPEALYIVSGERR